MDCRTLVIWLLLASPAGATTYFNPPVNTLVDGVPCPPCSGQGAAINQNFQGQIDDGNAAIAAIQAMLPGITGVGIPSGAVIMVNNSSCPTGFVPADGSTGSVDARGVYIRGLGGASGGLGALQLDQEQAHTHGAAGYLAGIFSNGTQAAAGSAIVWARTASGSTNTTSTMNAGGAPGSETKPDSVVLLHCYKS